MCTVYGSPCFCFIFPMCCKRRSMISWYILFCIESINQFMATNGIVKKSIHYMTFNLLKRFTSFFAINTSVSQTLPFFPPYLCSRRNSLIERISLICNGYCVQVQRNLSFPNICSEVFFACQISLFSCGHFPSQVPFSLSASKSTPLNEDNA